MDQYWYLFVCHGWLAFMDLLLRFCGTKCSIFAVHEVLFNIFLCANTTSVLLFTFCIWPQILPDIIRRSSKLFHNSNTASPAYVDLEVFQKAAENDCVRDISLFTHELRLIKSTAEIKLMRESASIACQVPPSFLLINSAGFMFMSWMYSPFALSYLLRNNETGGSNYSLASSRLEGCYSIVFLGEGPSHPSALSLSFLLLYNSRLLS